VEHEAVERVDDNRRSRRGGRDPAEDAGLRAVGVDDVIAAGFDQPVDLDQRDEVGERADAPSELRDDYHVRRLACPGE
jgi:hypothetical protein